jgi:long-chain acyl-CoA synthetase
MENQDVKTLRDMLNSSCEKYATKPALSFFEKDPLSYKDVGQLAKSLMVFLSEKGVEKGDRVALLGQNMPHWGVAYLAITALGAVVVPILVDFNDRELNIILRHSHAKGIIVSERLSSKLNEDVPVCVEFGMILDSLRPFDLEELKKNGNIKLGEQLKPTDKVTSLAKIEEDDLAAILYTSGTTGKPKGVMLSNKNLISNVINTLGIQKVDETDRLLSVLPMAHTYECTIGFLIPFMTGATVYYLEKPPTASILLPAMQKVKPTMMLTVPLIMEKIYNLQVKPKLHSKKALRLLMQVGFMRKFFHKIAGKKIYNAFGGNLQFFGVGGAKLSFDTEQFLRDSKFPYAIGYGLTETSPLLAGCSPSLTKFRSTGFSLPGQEVKIIDMDPKTGEGEIVAKGPNVMLGYFKEPEITAQAFTADGWFKTGDLGHIDKDGYIYIKGRLKNVILGPSGENIYPEDIESVINSEEFVLESLVYEFKGQLIAKVHLNYDEMAKRFSEFKDSATEYKDNMSHVVSEKLKEIREKVNSTMNKISNLKSVEEQPEPFEKTPTQKIKRFLYSKQQENNEKK